MTKPTSGKSEVDRRTFLYAATAATAVGVAGWGVVRRADAAVGSPADAAAAAHHAAVDHRAFCYTEGDPAYAQSVGTRPRSVRKSASRMSRQEIKRFSRAYRWAVAKGYFDVFNDEHFDHMRNRHHGADVLAVAPPAVQPGLAPSWGLRLLPWHRSFLLEAEAMLRAALADRNRHERGDPGEADRLFLPYWDATHDQDLPRWVKHLRPRGGTAIVPEGLPPGHAGYGKPVGSRYRIEFNRWPGRWLVFDKLPPPTRSAGSSATTTSWASTKRSTCS
jgi:tyrosinase-like protein